MECYSATKIPSFIETWVELEDIILNEISQAQKDKNCMFSLVCVSKKLISKKERVEQCISEPRKGVGKGGMEKGWLTSMG
jgi:hypothetical protein